MRLRDSQPYAATPPPRVATSRKRGAREVRAPLGLPRSGVWLATLRGEQTARRATIRNRTQQLLHRAQRPHQKRVPARHKRPWACHAAGGQLAAQRGSACHPERRADGSTGHAPPPHAATPSKKGAREVRAPLGLLRNGGRFASPRGELTARRPRSSTARSGPIKKGRPRSASALGLAMEWGDRPDALQGMPTDRRGYAALAPRRHARQ